MLPTVSIDTEKGPVLINQSDYDAAKHKLTDPQPEWSALFGKPLNAPPAIPGEPGAPLLPLVPAEPPAPPAPPSNIDPAAVPVTPPAPPPAADEPPAPPEKAETFVTKLGSNWFITGSDGKPLEGKNGEDGKGFPTKKAAEEANS